MNSKNRFILINLLAFEFLLLNLVLVAYLFFSLPEFSLVDGDFLKRLIQLGILYNLGWLFIVLNIKERKFYINPEYDYLKTIVISLFFFVGFFLSMVILFKIEYFERTIFIIPIFIFSFLIFISHKFLLGILKKKGSILFSKTLLIGSSQEFTKLNGFTEVLEHHGYSIVGYLEDGNEHPKNLAAYKNLGNMDQLSSVLTSNSIDEIFIAMSAMDKDKIEEAINIADSFGVRVKLIPEIPCSVAKNFKAVTIGDLAVFKLRRSPLDKLDTTILKRLFDFCFALVVLLLFSPLFVFIAICIYLDSKGPVFYTPLRKGEAGKTFKCYKFRTMSVNDNPINGTKSTIVNDPRITRIGRFLRKSDLDEMPQFLNVLKGEMSVIGPRPHRIHLQNDFRKTVNDYMVRSYVKPGITGWAQVNGWRGPTTTQEQKMQRIKHDLWYIENWSLWLDIKIIFLTIFGAHHKKAF